MTSDRDRAHPRIEEAAAQHPEEVTRAQQTAAFYLLDDMLAAAAQHGMKLTDFDRFTDLPTAAINAVRAKEDQ